MLFNPQSINSPDDAGKPYETKLAPDQELKFWQWLDVQHDAGNIHNGDYRFYKQNGYGYDYDFRAAFQAGIQPGANGHWDDLGKKPNHPTFSVFSKYANSPGVNPGKWQGDMYVPGANLKQPQDFNPRPNWTPPTLESIPMVHDGQDVAINQPKNQYLFRLIKALSDTRLNLDNLSNGMQQ